MKLAIHSDASYLSEPKARSRAGGHMFMAGSEEIPINNGAVLNMPQNTRPISILLETENTELCRLLDQAPPGKPPQVLPAPNSDITHRSRVPQIDYSKDYCVHNICQEYPKNTNLCGTNSCKTNYTCSPRCIRAQRQGCVRLVQPSPSLSGDRASPKAIPDTKYSVITISHKINTMTFPTKQK